MHLLKKYNKDKVKEIAKDFEFMSQLPNGMKESNYNSLPPATKTLQSWKSQSTANLKMSTDTAIP